MNRHRPDRTRRGSFGTLLAAACAVDSPAFIMDNNVFLSNPDGLGRYEVILDGTPAARYESPLQSDNGTVVEIGQTPAPRRQIYRVTQSGRLRNAPINTPTAGHRGDRPKGLADNVLMRYWFATTVNDPIRVFCVNASERALLSHADPFTGADEVGTPNGRDRPSSLDNKTITLRSGSARRAPTRSRCPHEQPWFNDGLFTIEGPPDAARRRARPDRRPARDRAQQPPGGDPLAEDERPAAGRAHTRDGLLVRQSEREVREPHLCDLDDHQGQAKAMRQRAKADPEVQR
jgi:hypothetical protein